MCRYLALPGKPVDTIVDMYDTEGIPVAMPYISCPQLHACRMHGTDPVCAPLPDDVHVHTMVTSIDSTAIHTSSAEMLYHFDASATRPSKLTCQPHHILQFGQRKALRMVVT